MDNEKTFSLFDRVQANELMVGFSDIGHISKIHKESPDDEFQYQVTFTDGLRVWCKREELVKL